MNKKIILFLLSSATFIFGCETQYPLQTIHKKHPRDYLYNNVPLEFKDKVTYYRALLEQTSPDEHSCGQRAIFHALALEAALQKAQWNIPISVSLRSLLSDDQCYRHVYGQINNMILSELPWIDLSRGTFGDQLARAGNRYFPQLQDKLLPLYVEDNELYIVDNGLPASQSSLNADIYTHHNRYIPLAKSDQRYVQFSKLKRPFDIIHFPTMLDRQHWVLASVMLNYKSERRLMVIDPCNIFLQYYPSFQTLIRLLHEEMQKG